MQNSRRRTFLKTAASVADRTMLFRGTEWAQNSPAAATFPKIHKPFLLTPDQTWQWNLFKSQGGPTYAGSTGWKRYTDFLTAKMHELGAVDFDSVEIPYDQYLVEDWPDRRTHLPDSGVTLEKLVSDGTPVPAIACYGMTSGSRSREGVTTQMLYYDPANPSSADQPSIRAGEKARSLTN